MMAPYQSNDGLSIDEKQTHVYVTVLNKRTVIGYVCVCNGEVLQRMKNAPELKGFLNQYSCIRCVSVIDAKHVIYQH